MSRKRKALDQGDFYICTAPSTEEDNAEVTTENDVSSEDRKNVVEKSLETFLFGESCVQVKEIDSDSDEEVEATEKESSRKVAWEDEDDEEVTKSVKIPKYSANWNSSGLYSQELKKKFVSIIGAPKWAELRPKEDDEDDEFFRGVTEVLSKKKKKDQLPKKRLEFTRMKDINQQTYVEGKNIQSTEFHPSSTVGLVAGKNGIVSLFQIDGKKNPKIQTVHFENFPISEAHFSSNGKELIASCSLQRYFYVYDMIKGKISKIETSGREVDNKGGFSKFVISPKGDLIAVLGRFGNIYLFKASSKQVLFTLKMNDEVKSVTFSSDGETLYSHGTGGEIYVWDIGSRDCVHKFRDDGCLTGTVVTLSRNNRFLAAGSSSGIVNVYERSSLLGTMDPKPLKVVKNLTTSISSLKFSPSSEILAIASDDKQNSVKLVHTPSMTVFENFPSLNFNHKKVTCLDFSQNGGYFGMGSDTGSAYLYRLNHYENY